MEKKTIVAEAENVMLALEKAKSQIPENCIFVTAKVISDGKPKTITKEARSLEEAWKKAETQLPPNTKDEERKVLREPGKRSIEINAYKQSDVTVKAMKYLNKEETIVDVCLSVSGGKGFLGIGKKNLFLMLTLLSKLVCKSTTNVTLVSV